MHAGEPSFAQPAQPVARAPRRAPALLLQNARLQHGRFENEEIVKQPNSRASEQPSFLSTQGAAVGPRPGAGRLLAEGDTDPGSAGSHPGDAAILRFPGRAEPSRPTPEQLQRARGIQTAKSRAQRQPAYTEGWRAGLRHGQYITTNTTTSSPLQLSQPLSEAHGHGTGQPGPVPHPDSTGNRRPESGG